MNRKSAPTAAALAPPSQRTWLWVGLSTWIVPLLVISVMVGLRPLNRTVTPLYHEAAANWWSRQPLYQGPSGMNYLPPFALLFTPFHLLPLVVADILWRWTAAAGLAGGLWLMLRRTTDTSAVRAFALISLAVAPLTMAALRNGQANAHFAAALLLAAAGLAHGRWWLATVFLALSLAIKPLGLAALGLAIMVFPPVGWRLALGTLVLLLLPFACAPTGYVHTQDADAWRNLSQCAVVTEHRFADLNGLLRTFGAPLAGTASLLVRGLAGLAFAAGCWFAGRRLSSSSQALLWLAAAAAYLMLFNPMTEANSYVILAPALGLWAWHFAETGRPRLAWTLAAMLLSMGLLPNLLRPWLGNAFALAWHPAMTLVFLGVVFWATTAGRGRAATGRPANCEAL